MDYEQFTCTSQADSTEYHCHLVYLQTAISLRHSDTIDARFLVNGTRVTVALPHAAFAQRSGAELADAEAAAIAASWLRRTLEAGGAVEDMLVPAEVVLQAAAMAS
jgi:hypothetical protein